MGLFDFLKKEPTRNLKTVEYSVRGIEHYLDNVKKLAVSNKEYRSKPETIIANGNAMKKIYQYTFVNKPVKLEPEPKNKFDKNAIKVIIAGEHIGYIPSEDCVTVHGILKSHEIKYMSAFISGGKYKVVSANGDAEHIETSISARIKIAYV